MRWIPAGFIALLAVLAVIGDRFRAYEIDANARCNYVLAEQPLPSADVLVIGASRVRRGIDPGYIEDLLSSDGLDVTVDRLSLTLPNFAQYYPLLAQYLDNRGAPQIAYLQLMYNFKPERQKDYDLPLNPSRNLAFGRMSDLIAVQQDAPLNDTGYALPKTLHANFQNLPTAWLRSVEIDVFSALRYVPKRLRGQMPACVGTFLRANGRAKGANGMTVENADAVAFVELDAEILAERTAVARDFLPLEPMAAWRRGETEQLGRLVDLLQGAGSEVVFLIMPSINQYAVDPATIADVQAAFPGVDIHFPMDAYNGALADKIAISFADTHHANDFGAIYLTRALAEDALLRLSQQ